MSYVILPAIFIKHNPIHTHPHTHIYVCVCVYTHTHTHIYIYNKITVSDAWGNEITTACILAQNGLKPRPFIITGLTIMQSQSLT